MKRMNAARFGCVRNLNKSGRLLFRYVEFPASPQSALHERQSEEVGNSRHCSGHPKTSTSIPWLLARFPSVFQRTPYWFAWFLTVSTFGGILPHLGVCASRWAGNGVRLEDLRTLLPIRCLHLSSVLLLGLQRVSQTLCDELSGSYLTSYRLSSQELRSTAGHQATLSEETEKTRRTMKMTNELYY